MFIYSVDNIDITSIIASENTTIKQSLCTTKFTSATNDVSFIIKSAKDITLYKNLLTDILNKRDQSHRDLIPVMIMQGSTYVFRGYLDESTLNISSAKLPENLTLSARDKTILLDNKVKENWAYENTTRTAIIQKLLTDSGCNIPLIATELPNTKTVRAYAVQEDDNETYRDKIDTVLKESPGYVLYYSASNDGFYIKKIIGTNETPRTINYRLESKLKTQAKVYDYDGILLTYPTIEEKKDQNIYAHNISLSINGAEEYDSLLTYSIGQYVTYDDKLYKCIHAITVPENWTPAHWTLISQATIIGDQVKPNYYYPDDSDIKKTVFDYTVQGLDRAYITKESREQNKDLSLIFAKNCHYDLIADPMLTPSPALPNIEYTGIEYMPRKAWIVLKNTNLSTSNVTGFSITGDVVYRSKVNKITAPVTRVSGIITSQCTNPEEIDTTTISTDSDAKEYANFLYNVKKFSSTISTWYETDLTSTLGEIVNVAHKETGIAMPSVIVSIDNESLGHNIRQYKITALSIKGYQTWTDDNIITSTNPTGKQEVNLPIAVTQFCYGSDIAPDGDTEVLVGDGTDVLGADSDIVGSTQTGWTEETLPPQNNKYIWCRIGHYTYPQTKADIVDWAVFRLSDVPRTFSLKLSTNTFTRNLRKKDNVTHLIISPEISGFSGSPVIKCHINTENGQIYPDYVQSSTTLDIPYTISTDIQKLIFVMEMIDDLGNYHKDVAVTNIKDDTGSRMVFDSTETAKTGDYDPEKDIYYIKGDSYVLVGEDESGNKTTTVMSYVDTATQWIPINQTDRATVPEFDGILSDSIAEVFKQCGDSDLNHFVANGYDWFKQIVANYITGVVYYVKGYIYGGDTANFKYDETGKPISLKGRGFILNSDGTLQANDGIFDSITVTNAIIKDSVISGKFVANAMETFDETAKIDSTDVTTDDWNDVVDDVSSIDGFTLLNNTGINGQKFVSNGSNILCVFGIGNTKYAVSTNNGSSWNQYNASSGSTIENMCYYNGYWYLVEKCISIWVVGNYDVHVYRSSDITTLVQSSNLVCDYIHDIDSGNGLQAGTTMMGYYDISSNTHNLICYVLNCSLVISSSDNGASWIKDTRFTNVDTGLKCEIIDIFAGLTLSAFPSPGYYTCPCTVSYYDNRDGKYYIQSYGLSGTLNKIQTDGAYTNHHTYISPIFSMLNKTYFTYNGKIYTYDSNGTRYYESIADSCYTPLFYKYADLDFSVCFGRGFVIRKNLSTSEEERVETIINDSESRVYPVGYKAIQLNGYIHVLYNYKYYRCRGIGYVLNKILSYFTSVKNKLNQAWVTNYESTHGVGSFSNMVEPLLSYKDVTGSFNFDNVNYSFVNAQVTQNSVKVDDSTFTRSNFSHYPIHMRNVVIVAEIAKLQTLDIEPKVATADIGKQTPFDEIHCKKLYCVDLPSYSASLPSGAIYKESDGTIKVKI